MHLPQDMLKVISRLFNLMRMRSFIGCQHDSFILS
ncbi:hypothetical protein OIU78_009493 [Salix suchowensis]|nr:hypothetical protein OIU78_009493 [Salix suchowensis]